MRQGWTRIACAALLAALVAAAPIAAHAAKSAAPRTAAATAKKSLRQYTGYVTALDKSSITVEKRGKKPESKTFAKRDDMHTTGEISKDAHVTVYYRDDGGRAIAHRVVVKTETAASGSR